MMKNDKEKVLTAEELEKRKRLTEGFLSSEFYVKYFEPDIKAGIEANNKINSINEEQSPEDILRDFYKKKYKRDIYQGILNKLKHWAEKKYQGGI